MLMSRPYKGDSELYGSCGEEDKSTKEGLCFLELRRNGMVQWGACGRVASVDQHEENNPQISSSIIKEEQNDDEETLTATFHGLPRLRKRKHVDLCLTKEAKAAKCSNGTQTNNPKEARAAKCTNQKPATKCLNQTQSSSLKAVRAAKSPNQTQTSTHKQIKYESLIPCKIEDSTSSKKPNFVDRWSIERYKLAEKHMLEVMKAEGAVFENPISRPLLRVAARKYIGDTGLLDHLLKHIDGKVAPGGTDRFRRCYNTEGTMEYWLESADLVKIKREAGVPDPTWIPPSSWTHGGVATQESVSTGEITLLKAEIAKLKRDMVELSSKNQEQKRVNLEQNLVNPVEEMQEELMKWRSKTDERLMEISSSLSEMKDMYQELMVWKSKTDQQLMEISSSLSNIQASKQCTTFSPVSERWEDWLESNNLDNIQGEDFAPWLGNTDLINIGQDTAVQECSEPQPWLKHCDSPSQGPVCAREFEFLKEEVAKMKRDVQDLLPKRGEDAQASVTPDSSVTNNSKIDLDNSLVLFQEMCKEVVKWKAKMEEKILEIANSVNTMQASKP